MPQEQKTFRSTAILSGSYDPDSQELEITFQSGKTYTYYNVPEHEWQGLCAADSAGRYVRQHIQPAYGIG